MSYRNYSKDICRRLFLGLFAQVLGEEHYNIHGSDDYLLDPGSVVADKLESGRQLNIIRSRPAVGFH